MKKLLLFFGLLLGLPVMAAPDTLLSSPLKSHVDERYELTSIVFRLAGAREYSQCVVPTYAKDIDSTFASYKGHKIVPFIQEVRNKYGVSYGDVSGAAGLLEIKNGKVALKPGINISKLTKDEIERWTPEALKTFISYLNDFYKKSNFRDFYTRHADLYRLAEKQLDERLAAVDIEWFEAVFGEKLEDPVIVASITNGISNYSGHVGVGNVKKQRIVIGAGSDNKGMPVFDGYTGAVIMHEFLHGFTNKRSIQYWPQMDSAAQKIFPYVREEMARNAYANAKTTMIEWFNNLMVNLYFLQHPEAQQALNLPIDRLIAINQNRGFIWMERSATFMQQFIDNRDKYPTIDSFMPQVVEFVKYTAGDFKQVIQEFKNQKPYIVSAFPAMGSTVTPDLDSIEFRFSRPMLGDTGYGYVNDETVLPLPVEKRTWKDDRTLVFVVKKGELQCGKTYGLGVGFSQSRKYYVMEGLFTYTFKVAEEKASAPTPENTAGNDKNPPFSSKTAEIGKAYPSKPTN